MSRTSVGHSIKGGAIVSMGATGAGVDNASMAVCIARLANIRIWGIRAVDGEERSAKTA